MEEITIIVADDHPIFRRGLRAVIESASNLKVIGEAENGESALVQIEELEPDVVVLDVNMPIADGLAVAREIKLRNLPTIPVFLTMHQDEAIFNAALEAEVKGFVIKDGAANEIIKCIEAVMAGQSFFSAQLSQFLLARHQGERSLRQQLTASERRILTLITAGKSNREIAHELFISVRTVEHHRAHISSKLNLKGKNALLTFALTNRTKL
jgi:DNA-binding NarL/FixJ family response regulator